MRSLSEKFNELRQQLMHGIGSIRPTGFDPVYYLLFPTHQIIEVKQRLPEWEAQLRVDGFHPHRLSMTAVINQYFRSHDLREPLIEAARLQSEDYSLVTRSLTTHLVNDNVVGAFHIIRTGFDGAVAPLKANSPPHRRVVSSDIEVPGACAPAENLFHVAQALSWIAGQRSAIEDQIDWMRSRARFFRPTGSP